MERNSHNELGDNEANALLCPFCCVAYVEVEFDLKVDELIFHNVKAIRCPICGEELFTPQQFEAIEKRIPDQTDA